MQKLIASHPLLKRMWKYRYTYLLLLPAIIWYFFFCYVPMYGLTLSVREFSYSSGVFGGEWVGLKYFQKMAVTGDFWRLLSNTLRISFAKLGFVFVSPIILALMLNEMRVKWYKSFVQTVSYLPYFVSWVVIATMISKIFSPNQGIVNELLGRYFGTEPFYFLGNELFFYIIIILSDTWKIVGWNSILYLSALGGISPELYDAAYIDGAGRWKAMLHVTLPGLRPTIAILFILAMNTVMYAGFEQIYLLQNPAVMSISEIIDTFVIRVGIRQANYSYATAVGLIQSVVSLVLIAITNYLSKKYGEVSVW